MEMSDKIKALRKANDMTLEELGNIVGVGKSTVRKWENGDIRNMRRDKIAKLAKALSVSPSYLMGWEDEKGVTDVVLAKLDYMKRTGCSMEEADKYVEAVLAAGKGDDIIVTAQDAEIIRLVRQLSPEREKMFLDLLKDLASKQ